MKRGQIDVVARPEVDDDFFTTPAGLLDFVPGVLMGVPVKKIK